MSAVGDHSDTSALCDLGSVSEAHWAAMSSLNRNGVDNPFSVWNSEDSTAIMIVVNHQ